MPNREIKFRWWWEETKKMYYKLSDPWSTFEPGGEFIPMQYIGLKDKNGKEIYEGDIVKTDSGTRRVVFHEGFYGVTLLKHDNLFPSWTELTAGKPEVIGNIYENKELLND